MRQFIFCVLAFAFLLSMSTVSAKLFGQPASSDKSLDTLFQNRIARKEIAGLVCLISQKGQITYERALGYRNIEEGLPMTKNSLFRLQSMTKPIISLAALKLVDKGQIDLDEPASKYFPELKDKMVGLLKDDSLIYIPADKPITLRHLLSHSSGLGSSWNAGNLKSIYEKFGSMTPGNYKEVVKAYVQLPLINHPGNAWHYGSGHLVIANIIEKVTGMTIEKYLEKEIFRPLGMNRTTFSLPKEKQKELAQYYSVTNNGQLKKTLQDLNNSWGIDLFSTAEDYHKFCQLLLNNGQLNGKSFIRPEIIRELYKAVISQNGDEIGWQKGYAFGLGVSVRVDDEKANFKGSLGDYGWFGGFNTAFWIDPKKQMIGIILTQSYHNFYQLSKEAKNIVYSDH